jgi:predicted RNase H-like nuclease (RuvC/YqgF family)
LQERRDCEEAQRALKEEQNLKAAQQDKFLNDMAGQRNEFRTEIALLKARASRLQDDLNDSGLFQKELSAARIFIASLKAQVEGVTKERDDLEAEVEQLRKSKRLKKASYEIMREQVIELLNRMISTTYISV